MLEYIVTILIIAAFLMLVFKKDLIAIGAILISFLIMIVLFLQPGIAIVGFGGWIAPFGIVWVMDRLNVFIGLLITGMSSLVAIYSIKYIEERKHRFYTLLCLMTAGLLGVCLTGDIFNMYVFFEILAISSYGLVSFFLDEDAIEGAFKYIIMGSFGSSFILLGIALLYGLTGTLNFAYLALSISHSPMFMISLGLIIGGFGMKAAIIPFHAWKPDAIEGTPSPIGAIFTTVSSAIGVYGIVRMLFIFNLIQLNFALVGFGVLTMMVGAFLALVQTNVKRMLAYSSISQIGYVIMAIGFGTTLGLTSGLYHILNNALIKGLLFMGIGCIIFLTGKENLDEMGMNNTPLLICIGIGVLAMAGIPPFNGFVSKLLIFLASWEISPILTILAIIASAITLAYGLKIFSSIFLNGKRFEGDIPKIMLMPVVILTILCVLIGIFPQLGLELVEPATNALLNQNQYITAVLGGG
jgi:multicomponent Na+:H+ antiporter subunit D